MSDYAFDPVRVSPSRVNAYLSCGVAFEMKYVQGLPEQVSGSAALFGSVVHKALETWSMDRSLDLVRLMAEAWLEVTDGTTVADFLKEYQGISIKVMQAEKQARELWEADPRNKGKVSKAPRMTKYFKESSPAKELDAMLARWVDKLNEGSPWKFSEYDPLPSLYDESLILGKKYAARWGHLAPALHAEFGFTVMWEGFELHGYIDTLEPLFGEEGNVAALIVNDYKTYKKEPPEQKDWRQAAIYDVAVRDMIARGVIDLPGVTEKTPLVICIDYVRMLERKYWQLTKADHAQLLKELRMYRAGIDNSIFLPASKNSNPDFCAYPDQCCLRTKGEGCGQRIELSQEAPDGSS